MVLVLRQINILQIRHVMKQEAIQVLSAAARSYIKMVVQLYKSAIGMVIATQMASSIQLDQIHYWDSWKATRIKVMNFKTSIHMLWQKNLLYIILYNNITMNQSNFQYVFLMKEKMILAESADYTKNQLFFTLKYQCL